MRTRTDPHEIRLLRRAALILGVIALSLLLILVIQWSKWERRIHGSATSTETATADDTTAATSDASSGDTSDDTSGDTSDTEEPPETDRATETLLLPTSPAEVETETDSETETTPSLEGDLQDLLDVTEGLLFEPNDGGGCTLIGVEADATAVVCVILPPLSPDGLPVTEIAPGAFSGCERLAAVFLPATLQTLRADAFDGCTSLVSITVDMDSTAFCTRDGVLYDADCHHLIFCPPARAIPLLTLPAELTHIDENALAAATGIQAVTYEGTKQDWAQVEIARGNNLLSVLGVVCGEE